MTRSRAWLVGMRSCASGVARPEICVCWSAKLIKRADTCERLRQSALYGADRALWTHQADARLRRFQRSTPRAEGA